MGFWRIFGGMVKLELISARLQWTLMQLNLAGLEVFGLQQEDELTGCFWVRRRDCDNVIALCESREGKIRVLDKKGLYWQIKGLLKRPLLLIWFALIPLFCLYLPSRILFVKVDGNEQIPARQIIAAAEDCGIRFGASRREVRSEKMKNALLTAIPQLQWAGVNTSGCVATISVRERTENMHRERPFGVSSIVAERDGYILSASATKGNLLVQPGQTVKAGQLMISGYTDCGLSIRAERAEGEILAQTNRQVRCAAPLGHAVKQYTGREKKKISIVLGKKRIFLWKDSGISGMSCGRMYEEYYITLPGGFCLPVMLCIERFAEYNASISTEEEGSLDQLLAAYAQTYLIRQMSAGEILHEDTATAAEAGCRILEGTYVCREMIGRVRPEQIGDTNGKDSGTNR